MILSRSRSRSSGAPRTRSRPGHGKAIVTAISSAARHASHAAALGLIVTFTHTVGVFALGLVTLALSQFIVPEELYPWIDSSRGCS